MLRLVFLIFKFLMEINGYVSILTFVEVLSRYDLSLGELEPEQ